MARRRCTASSATTSWRRSSKKPTSPDDEWYKSLVKAVQALDDHIAVAPAETSLARAALDPPRLAGLSECQRAAIQRQIGSETIANLAKKWPLLNDKTREAILAVVKQ
jgi:hypothetical protein